ncbi:MAG: 2-C-methyl-D-erythritol 2,4-cyclodiphosphate synthase [Candidatus Omnitrophota bacterium]|nr:2-C-methyl-D-erythritol 2,4-cyclodiphosphate synthase [Candidatus Omnitrophota bacterium]
MVFCYALCAIHYLILKYMVNYRIGLGFDVHRFSKKNKPLVLGAMKISRSFGLEAVSDGDVLLHAITDALCGACSLGDIGDYFPPSKKYEGIDSKEIAKFILHKLGKKFKIANIDITIVAEKPKLFPHKKDILKSLKSIFRIRNINVKIKSKEGLNILGGKDAISCFAIALVRRI